MFSGFVEARRRKRALAEIVRLANATLPGDAMRVTLASVPQTSDGIVKDEIRFSVHLASMVQFGIRPLNMRDLSATLNWFSPSWQSSVGVVRFSEQERPLAIGKEFLGPSEEHIESITAKIEWSGCMPPTGAAVSLGFSGTVVLYAPWSPEYQNAVMHPEPIVVRMTDGAQAT